MHDILTTPGRLVIAGAPEGLDALVLGDFARAVGKQKSGQASLNQASLLHIARDDQRMARLAEALRFFAPDINIIQLPAWDCLPYDRVSPNNNITSRRLASLAQLVSDKDEHSPLIVLTTVNAALQLMPAPETIKAGQWRAVPGNVVKIDELTKYLSSNGFFRVSTVNERGEFAVRGGIVDIFAPGEENPMRLDFFGDTLESIRTFDTQTQRTIAQCREIIFLPAAEIILNEESISRFRSGYTGRFGAVTATDPLYEAVSEGRTYQGMEHWLPLFHEQLASVFDYLPKTPIFMDHLAQEAADERQEQIADYYDARKSALKSKSLGASVYNPLEPEELYISQSHWQSCFEKRIIRQFTPFEEAPSQANPVLSLNGKQGRNFAAEREQTDVNVFDVVAKHLAGLRADGKRILVTAWSEGARNRLLGVLTDHGVANLHEITDWSAAQALTKGAIGLGVLGLEAGFETDDLAVLGEQDILGDRLVRRRSKTRKASDILAELSTLSAGDLVVHADHGIGRFEDLRTIDVQGAPHDCFYLTYHGGDRLFLPVENAELLTRYGGEDTTAQLDKLGGGAWQARKARLKKRIHDIAEKLIETAAARALRKGDVIASQDGSYEEFAARFPFEETDDQLNAIEAVLQDLGSGRPMDRLICGDVGFGKTEVALRSAFVTAMDGRQVALVVPTTLLARQHYATFVERFAGLPINIAQLSRLVGSKEMKATREGIANGEVDIVIGTHALLAKTIRFKNLSLMIIDEEQHFGVNHKERLKSLRAQVHVLTLTATPIPRTLQLALTGVRDLSLIATPPVDRLAVRTFITPFDPVVIREALLRELYRGGQSFYVCPRVSDLEEIREFLREHIPEVKVVTAHGQMPPGQLDDVMTAFYDRQYDVLLSTTIIESGLDIPTANTLIVHRSEMFGLSQMYQLRGRVGRSKTRAYALFTIPPNKTLTVTADRRLKVLQSLDTLGAGFSLASHDMDIRGAGNLLGEEQSGHIREVGFELYQDMLEEAVAKLSADETEDMSEDQWSPQINLGVAVLIPENYVEDLTLRLALYRRLSSLQSRDEVDDFGAELIDRFGKYPTEVDHLLKVITIKTLCKQAGVSSIDAGAKGCVVSFHNDQVANPVALIDFISERAGIARLRPDHKLVYKRDWDSTEDRINGAHSLLTQLARLAATPES